MSSKANVNGVARKSLSEQIDRLDGILDGLAEGLIEAVATAVREALAPALQESLGGLVAETLAGPEVPSLPDARDTVPPGKVREPGRGKGFLSRAWAWFQARVRQALERCNRAARGIRAALYQLWRHKGRVLAALGLLATVAAAGTGRWESVAGRLAEVATRTRWAWSGLLPTGDPW